MEIRCIIVEDDPISEEVMKGLVGRAGFLDLQTSFNDPLKAIQWLASNPTDLILLDIEMPGLNGLEMLRSLPRQPHVIIITSKEQYAIEAFDYDVTAYLLKPVTDYARFLKAVLKVREKLEASWQKPAENIFVRADSLLTNLALSDILWIEAFGDYVKINTDKKVFTVYSTMKAVEEKLPSEAFMRVHRSFLINVRKIDNIDQGNLQIGAKIIPVGSSYRDSLMKRINTL